jgi:D-3-phosphoglycerate dehydrogenase
LIESGALYEALRLKKIAGAALDVYDEEPLPLGHPLTTLLNVVFTPHNSGLTPEAAINGLMMAVENVEAFLSGKRMNPAYVVVKGTR